MTLVIKNSDVLDVIPLLMCSAAYWYLYFAVLDATLNIMYMLWNVYVMSAERHVVVPLWRSICMFSKKKKKKTRVVTLFFFFILIIERIKRHIGKLKSFYHRLSMINTTSSHAREGNGHWVNQYIYWNS